MPAIRPQAMAARVTHTARPRQMSAGRGIPSRVAGPSPGRRHAGGADPHEGPRAIARRYHPTVLRVIYRHLTDGPLLPVPEFDTERAILDLPLWNARRDARRGDWTAARAVIEEAGDDWELRARRIGSLSRLTDTDRGWFDSWQAAAPSDPIAVQVLAETLSHQASSARGGATADKTSTEQFRGFFTLSAAAADACDLAMKLAGPNDPNPWVTRLGTMFTGASTAEFDGVLEEGRRRDPFHFGLHGSALAWRCEKWFGSHDLMFATARDVAGAAPEGASAVLLPLLAHYEYVLREFNWGEEKDEDKALAECHRYFQRPEVEAEIDGWIAKWRAGTPNPANAQTLRQWIALFYCLVDRRKASRAVFEELGPYVDPALAWSRVFGGREYGYVVAWYWANGLKRRKKL
ncbi:hypothetical protein Ait01nite_035500 [Actinoplanes italicus]|nr:hypothetical protein Ait01nite_035500 [Actinoplanes italicus]